MSKTVKNGQGMGGFGGAADQKFFFNKSVLMDNRMGETKKQNREQFENFLVDISGLFKTDRDYKGRITFRKNNANLSRPRNNVTTQHQKMPRLINPSNKTESSKIDRAATNNYSLNDFGQMRTSLYREQSLDYAQPSKGQGYGEDGLRDFLLCEESVISNGTQVEKRGLGSKYAVLASSSRVLDGVTAKDQYGDDDCFEN